MAANGQNDQLEQSMRPFFIVWTGQAFSLLGSMLVDFAIVWWLTRTTGSATMLAMATLVALLPQIFLGPFAGALVDRWSRKTVLIAADSVTALATLALAGLFALHLAGVGMIYALLLVRSAAGAFHWPAMQASTTMLVPREKLTRAAGMNQTLSGAAGIVIPPLGALAIEALPLQAVLAIDVITAMPAILCLLFVTIPQPVRQAGSPGSGFITSIMEDLREGVRYTLRWRALLYFMLIGLSVGVLARAGASLIPIMITRRFAGGAIQLGWWQSGYGAGFVLGGLILGVWSGLRKRMLVSMLSLALDGVACLLIAFTPKELFWITVVLMGALGVLEALIFGINGAIGQSIIPPEMQGRIFALAQSAAQVAAPLGLLIAGPFADAFGVQVWWLISAAAITATGLAALLTPSLMHIEDKSGPPRDAVVKGAAA